MVEVAVVVVAVVAIVVVAVVAIVVVLLTGLLTRVVASSSSRSRGFAESEVGPKGIRLFA